MENSGLKKQQIYLMEKVRKLSYEIVNVMELLELVSQIIDQDNEEDDDSDSDVKMGLNDLIETYSDEKLI
jgi:hypothetical protein